VRLHGLVLLVRLVDPALCRVRVPVGLGLGLGEQLIGLRPGLRDDIVSVLLRAADQLLGVRVGIPPGLLGLRAGLRGALFGRRGPLLSLRDQALGRGLSGGQALGLLPLGLLAPRRELDVEFGLGLSALGLALLQDSLRLAAHLVGLTL
jgi:hypothetical protein